MQSGPGNEKQNTGTSIFSHLFSAIKKGLIALRESFKNIIHKIRGVLFKKKAKKSEERLATQERSTQKIASRDPSQKTAQQIQAQRVLHEAEHQKVQQRMEELSKELKESKERSEQWERERIESQKIEAQRIAAAKAEAERMKQKKEQEEAERRQKEQAQQAERERIAQLKKEEQQKQEQLAAQRIAAEAEKARAKWAQWQAEENIRQAKVAAEKKAAKEAKLKELAEIHYSGQPGEMRLIEKDIIAALEENKNERRFQKLITEYQQSPFGNSSEAFLNHPTMKLYFSELHKHTDSIYEIESHLKSNDKTQNFRLWMLIEHYNLEKSEIKKSNYLKRIRTELQEIRAEIYKPSGQGLFKQINQALIKNVYLSNDPKLINLFMRNPTTKLPVPGIALFEEGAVPTIIQQKHDEAQSATAAFQKRLPHGEAWVTYLQRDVRGRQRQRKEKSRLAQFSFYIGRQIQVDNKWRYRTEQEIQEQVAQALKDGNTPYIPKKCSPEFAQKLVEVAGKVKLFDTIRHETSETHLNLILDEGLKGKKTLLEQGSPFKRGALQFGDLETGGDAAVICFGVKEIVSQATHPDPIQIILDVNKIKPNPCMFYKQRDFGYGTSKVHQSSLEGASYFTHGDSFKLSSGAGYTNLQIKEKNDKDAVPIAYSELPAHFFMAYDVSKMHQILTLNFFRFVDTLYTGSGNPDENRIKNIYASLEKIFKEGGEPALAKELERIGIEMTHTAEVDFYSTYLIDFSAVQSIKNRSFTLELPSFIMELKKGNMDQLMAAQKTEDPKGIPNLFKSYRFLNYLLSKPHADQYPENILTELNRLKALCPKPAYLDAKYNTQSATGKNEETATPGGVGTLDPRSTPSTTSKK